MASEAEFRPVVVAPTFNHAPRVIAVLEAVRALGLPVIVVDDGSTDETQELVARWSLGRPAGLVQVIRHPKNRGKAAALHSGFRAAIARGMTHALTLDTDGQHHASDGAALLDAAREHPLSLILGRRGDAPSDARRSDTLRRLLNLAVYMECGVRLADSQCGLRVYPMKLVENLPVHAQRFAYEMEVITRCVWAGGEVVQAAVTDAPLTGAVSHYRRWTDTLRAIGMHGRLLMLSLAPWHKRRWPVDRAVRPKLSLVRTALAWLNPMRAVRELVDDRVGAGEVGAAAGVGVFIATLPIPFLQTAAILYIAGRLHLNPMIALVVSFISTPPLTVALWGSAVILGHVMLSLEWPDMADYHYEQGQLTELAGRTLLEMLVGSVALGTLLATLAFVTAVWFVRVVRRRRHARMGDALPQTSSPPSL